MVYMKILKSLIILLSVTALSYSQATLITLQDAINNAYKNNTNIIKTQNSIEIQENNIRATYGSLLPDLKFSAGWTRTRHRRMLQALPGREENRAASRHPPGSAWSARPTRGSTDGGMCVGTGSLLAGRPAHRSGRSSRRRSRAFSAADCGAPC